MLHYTKNTNTMTQTLIKIKETRTARKLSHKNYFIYIKIEVIKKRRSLKVTKYFLKK